MAKLVCKICGGSLRMDIPSNTAICEVCGMKYNADQLRDMANGAAKVTSIDKKPMPVQHKPDVATLEELANNAFNNRNFAEAEKYYSQILEVRPSDWFAAYRKALCAGWQDGLTNLNEHATEVAGSVVNAVKAMDAAHLLFMKKADATVQMCIDFFSWIQDIQNLVEDFESQFAGKIASAARAYLQQETMIAYMCCICMKLINEFVFQYTQSKKAVDYIANSICNTANIIACNLNKSFNVKTGTSYDPFYGTNHDVFEKVAPDQQAVEARVTLRNEAESLYNNIHRWMIIYR